MSILQQCANISTHAPARGATWGTLEYLETLRISTHAPARGATPRVILCLAFGIYFNPRPCTRSDANYGYQLRSL